MALSYTSSQRRPFQGECRRRSRLSTIQEKVRSPSSLPLSPLHIDSFDTFTAPNPPTWNTEATPQNLSFDTQLNSDFNNSQSNTLDPYGHLFTDPIEALPAIPASGIEELGIGGNLSDTLSDQPSDQWVNSVSAVVSKPNVTTTAMAGVSMLRRINEARFTCLVCGSTFTKRTNLTGALRRSLVKWY